ncbi:hypothetical protein KUTeg_016892 [Tegillarca granosa]|uniref:Uncharacterized protein n=1 Tax=Tegillarca granosa TaxID=220873 RepID=A0ABQ9ER05_TEGGR|nr:hypothetical protein KUTeg_016892 [Tegillarca granosa]
MNLGASEEQNSFSAFSDKEFVNVNKVTWNKRIKSYKLVRFTKGYKTGLLIIFQFINNYLIYSFQV